MITYSIGEVVNINNTSVTILDYFKKGNTLKCTFKCNICGFIDTKGYRSFTDKRLVCDCCTCKKRLPERNSVWVKYPELRKLFQNPEDAKKYMKSDGDKLQFICPFCGKLSKPTAIRDICRNALECKCKDSISYPEKLMTYILNSLNVYFYSEYNPEWCTYIIDSSIRHGRYDFYFELDNKKYIVEMDGAFHYKNNDMNGMSKEEVRAIDRQKDLCAKNNNIEVIRINCLTSKLEFIKNNVLTSKLNNILDLSIIDWFEVDKFATGNFVKYVCELYMQGKSKEEISKETRLRERTIQKYLIKGYKFGWSNVVKEELVPVGSYKNEKLIGVFECAKDCANKSFEAFGLKLDAGNISACIRGDRIITKGLSFKALSKEDYEKFKLIEFPKSIIFFDKDSKYFNRTPIEVWFKNNFIGYFSTCAEFIRLLETNFNISLITNNITDSIKNNSVHKGFSFKVMNKDELEENRNELNLFKNTNIIDIPNKHRPIKVYKDNKLLGYYKSANYISKNSISILDISIYSSNVTKGCKTKKFVKGYLFEFISDEEYSLVKDKIKG